MMITSIDDTRRLLRNWGRWSRERLGTEYSALHPMWRDAVEQKGRVYEGIFDDDIALTIDAAIAQLRYFDDLGHQLIVRYYRDNYTVRMLAEANQCSTSLIRPTLKGAEGYLSGAVVSRLKYAA